MRTPAIAVGALLLASTALTAPALAEDPARGPGAKEHPHGHHKSHHKSHPKSHPKGHQHGPKVTSESLRRAVTVRGVMNHLRAFQAIAEDNDGTRSSGTPGYRASVRYVVGKLRSAGYRPEVQQFAFPYFEQLGPSVLQQVSPTPTTYVEDTDYSLMTYSGNGDVTAPVQAVDLNLGDLAGSTSGCEASDFAGFTAGNIALVRRGSCTFGVKVANAEAAGAVGAIVMNSGVPGATDPFAGTLGEPAGIPAVGASFALGQALAQAGAVTVRLAADTASETRQTWNVTAETRHGRDDNAVMAGAHLDSVVDGPGINDNGSGSAALLEVALKMAKAKTRNTVRFAWWGAEEFSLLGSEHYVDDLVANDPDRLAEIALYLNFDMIASPNYVLGVYDGDASDFEAEPPEGSAQIEEVFTDYFASVGLPSVPSEFSGRSDYGPFIAQDIPAGGLFTGAEGVKTAAEAALFGGTAGVAYDECYHQACDDLDNVSRAALDANSDAIAHAVITYARSTYEVNGRR
ncbi:M28 family metallopeptidase [Nocardioides houyundeii]|uniref:M28 family metallopeptidase n=1 Tax=Nocardioides houyundeii TaxID=2045452 RepID=UPI0018EF6F24|nr:M28 family metallopeptidase [Nocardioides houyundeii]